MNFVLTAFVAYLLGSIPSGVIVSRVFGKRDVRNVGSGHTGALNTFRAAGFFSAAFTFLADAGKAVLALEFARWTTASEWGFTVAGIAVVIGHCFPIYTWFHGGMGLATSGTVLFLLDGPILILIFLLWFPVKYLVKHSARASSIIALVLPILLLITGASFSIVAFGLGVGVIIFLRHLPDWNRA